MLARKVVVKSEIGCSSHTQVRIRLFWYCLRGISEEQPSADVLPIVFSLHLIIVLGQRSGV